MAASSARLRSPEDLLRQRQAELGPSRHSPVQEQRAKTRCGQMRQQRPLGQEVEHLGPIDQRRQHEHRKAGVAIGEQARGAVLPQHRAWCRCAPVGMRPIGSHAREEPLRLRRGGGVRREVQVECKGPRPQPWSPRFAPLCGRLRQVDVHSQFGATMRMRHDSAQPAGWRGNARESACGAIAARGTAAPTERAARISAPLGKSSFF